MSEGFEGNADTFLLFFRACRLFHINTEQDRIKLLRKMAARKILRYHRDGQALMKGKKCLVIKHSPNSENG